MKFILAALVLSILGPTPLFASERFHADDSTCVITDIETGLEWICAPDTEVGWFEAFVWLEELNDEWRCPSIAELSELFEAGISLDTPDPFVLGGNWVWCGEISNYDSVYCFDFISGYITYRVASWRAYEYMSGFRAFAVR